MYSRSLPNPFLTTPIPHAMAKASQYSTTTTALIAGPENSVVANRTDTPPEGRPHHVLPKGQAPIHRIPAEVLIKIIRLIVPTNSNKTPYHFSTFTHVCWRWRSTFINYPRAWTIVPATNKECRGFVEMCLERSRNLPLDVRITVWDPARNRAGCTCNKDAQGRFLPNRVNPCEWHFIFEALAGAKHTNRITALDVDFENFRGLVPTSDNTSIVLGSCRFFASSFPQLTDLTWNNSHEGFRYDQLFQHRSFPPTLRSLDLQGAWRDPFLQIRGLTSLALHRGHNAETLRVFLLENQSLESLSLTLDHHIGASRGPPVELPKLRFLNLEPAGEEIQFPDFLHVPAIRSLTSLQAFIIHDNTYAKLYALRATGGSGFTLSLKCAGWAADAVWRTFTGHARPTIGNIYVGDGTTWASRGAKYLVPILDAHTLEVELIFTHTSGYYYDTFWNRVKRAGPQLKTIRFEVSEDMDPLHSRVDDLDVDNQVFDRIEGLVKHRFEQGHPFAAVERLAVSENERVNRLQAHVWRCFYNGRDIGRYVVPI